MNNICTNRCSLHYENQRCSGQVRLPQTPAEARKWNSDAQSGSHYKFQCKYEERKRKAEAKRSKLVQKLKFEHSINVDELSSRAFENILLQAEIIDKQKRMREKDKIHRRFHFISKLVQEEKYKSKDAKSLPVLQKKMHKISQSKTIEAFSTRTEETENLNLSLNPEVEGTKESDDEVQASKKNTEVTKTEESVSNLAQCDPKQSQKSLLPLEFFASPKRASVILLTESNENYLKCIPDCIVFENCKPNKTYNQTYKISNIGFDDIHCRYAGIVTESQKIPIRVEMTDSVLLRPGLSFTGKVKMVSALEIMEVNGFLIYESRRKKNPNKKACFRIPFKCLPVRSIVEVSPSAVRFPSVTWYTATGKKRSKHLRKTIFIKNLGGKDCSCCIVKSENLTGSFMTSKTFMEDEESVKLDCSFDPKNGEIPRENNYFRREYEEVLNIMSELVGNVFEVFRFSRKYHIPLPAMSTTEVNVDFLPEYRGYHHEVVLVRFEDADNCSEEKLEMIGEIKKIPLRVEPQTIDLKICIINTGLYEGTFRVYNESNSPSAVHLKVPGSMKEHALVFPKDLIIQPWSYQICSVRLFPRPSISIDAFRYYKEETKVLEFPVFIHLSDKTSCKWDRIKVYVFAILTNYDLELQPSEINFGLVTTLETIRTEINLINHSMCPQEFGFLHLPKGVRIEPNYGFGTILPKETIRLYLLYSPVLKFINNRTEEGNYNFQVEVTSVAKLCRFLIHSQESSESTDSVWGEEPLYNTEIEGTPIEIFSPQYSQVNEEEKEDQEEAPLTDDEAECKELQNKQKKIREYLSQNIDFFPTATNTENSSTEQEGFRGENEGLYAINSLRDEKSIITCTATVIKPFCELSSTVIQLPATPMSSMSVTRFRINTNPPEKCNCNFTLKGAKPNLDFFFEALFEFHTSSTLIKIEPQTGHIIRGQSLPVAIIFRPEFSKGELAYGSRVLKAEFLFEEAKPKNVTPSLKPKSKTNVTKPIRDPSRNQNIQVECQEVNLTDLEITKTDLFVGEKELLRMIDPFHLEFKVICVMKILPCQGILERMEYHTLKLTAPVIKPSFIFLGNCQEISFGKVAVGDSSKKIIGIQNISLNRISPRISALNPYGPFTCTTCSKMDKIDPEHIWRHPITFSPTAEKGKETEFFELQYGVTSIPLAVNGEGIIPKYAFTPDFAMCILETTVDVTTEVEFSVENLCEAELKFNFVLDFIRKSSNYRDEPALTEINESQKSDITFKKPERKMNQMTKDGAKRIVFKNEIIPKVAQQLAMEFISIQNPPNELFTIVGLDKNNQVLLSPFGKCLLKIKFSPIKETVLSNKGENSLSTTAYAVGYKIMLSRNMLKNLTIIGTLQSEK